MSDPDRFPADPESRLTAVRDRIRRAAERAGRDPERIVLVAVSKTAPAERVLDLARAGHRIFGENRVQEARDKIPAVAAGWSGPKLTWRLIGHLQRNKVNAAIAAFDRIDSIDSDRVLDAVSEAASREGRRIPILLQFNCSGEGSKGGFAPGALPELAAGLAARDGVDLRGLMTIGPLDGGPEAARPAFRLLARLHRDLEQRLGRELPELSMGMSGDLEIGIEEGATVVRVGTALFGARS